MNLKSLVIGIILGLSGIVVGNYITDDRNQRREHLDSTIHSKEMGNGVTCYYLYDSWGNDLQCLKVR